MDGSILTIMQINKNYKLRRSQVYFCTSNSSYLVQRSVIQLAKNQPPYRVISTPPKDYKLPDLFWDLMIQKAMERVRKQQAG